MLDGLQLEPLERRAPGPGEVEIEVHVTGLNFRDVLIALDLYPEQVDHARRRVQRRGRRASAPTSTTLQRRRPRAWRSAPGAFASHVTTRRRPRLIAVPAGIDLDDAATIPITFLTAHYALVELGRLRAGERVLIHAGAGGVGMAAIQLAQRARRRGVRHGRQPGEAGHAARRSACEHVFDSRSLDFADGVLRGDRRAPASTSCSTRSTGEFIDRSLERAGARRSLPRDRPTRRLGRGPGRGRAPRCRLPRRVPRRPLASTTRRPIQAMLRQLVRRVRRRRAAAAAAHRVRARRRRRRVPLHGPGPPHRQDRRAPGRVGAAGSRSGPTAPT